MGVRFRRAIVLCNLLTVLSVGLGSESLFAQSLSSRQSRKARPFNGHSLPCPSCQQANGCKVHSEVDSTPSTGLPEIIHLHPSDDQPSQDQVAPAQPSPTRPSASEGFSQNTSQFDSSQFNPQSRGRSDQLASRGSNNLNSAIEFQGDFFGVRPVPAVATQVYDLTLEDPVLNQIISVPGGTLQITEINDDAGTLILGESTITQPDGFQFVAGSGVRQTNQPGQQGETYNAQYGLGTDVAIPTSLTGRLKFAENVGLIPRDRFFFNYNYFHNVPLTTTGTVGVNRFTPGFEKTFLGDLASIEVRTPFSATLSSDIFATGPTDQRVQFGNIFVSLKGLLVATDRFAVTSGTSVSLPTEEDIRVLRADSTELVRIKNESVHILPFFGFCLFPNSRIFAQFMSQVDIDTNGRPVLVNDANTMEDIGRFRDQTLMFNSAAVAYRLWTSDGSRRSMIRSVIPTFEVHWNRSLDRSNGVTNGFSTIGNTPNFETVNLISGLTFDMRHNSRMAVGYVAPVSRTDSRVFDGELRVMFNKYY